MEYKVTELIGIWSKENHKVPISKEVIRRNHVFDSLEKLAIFCRENTIFTSYHKEIEGKLLRDNETSEPLYEGNNLLWLDLDWKVNIQEVKEKLIEHNLKGFAFYTSKYYKENVSRARLCLICDKIISKEEWGIISLWANQAAIKLDLTSKEKIDTKIYSFCSFLSWVKGDYKKGDLIINSKGNLFKYKPEECMRNEIKNEINLEKRESYISKYIGKIGILSDFLFNINSVSDTRARGNNTISLSFTSISEKTKLGYYININDPWLVNHPNKPSMYLSNCLTKEEFKQFKKFYFKKIYQKPIIDLNEIEWDSYIEEDYIESEIFNNDELIFLQSPTGSGKTTAISEWITINPEKSVLFISVNRMQAVANYKALIKKGIQVTCYLKHSPYEFNQEKKGRKRPDIHNLSFQENAAKGIIPQRLICGILSLHHLIDENNLKKIFDYVIIDEISTLPNSVSNNIGIIYERLPSFEKALKCFKFLLTSAEKVICMDGYISKSIVELITKLSKKESLLVKNTKEPNKSAEIFVCSGGQPKFEGKGTCKKFLELMIDDVKKASFGINKRLMVVAISTLELSKSLFNSLLKNFPDKNIKVFNSEETEKNPEKIIKMFEDLDTYMKNEDIDIMIYSPTITTGVDIPQADGTNVYHVISGDTLSSHINYQMTMRGRKAKYYRVLMSKLLINRKECYKDFNDYISKEIKNIKESLPFKSPRSIKWKSRNFTTSGILAIYSKLEYHILEKDWKKVNDTSSLKKALLTMSKELNYDLTGLKVAFAIDKAYIEFQIELYKHGQSGYEQYINFLKHEQCKISIEEDVDYHSFNYYGKYDNDTKKYQENYKKDYSDKLKEIGCWKKRYDDLKYIPLFKILKVAKVFYIFKDTIINTYGIGKLSNDTVLDIYCFLFKLCLKSSNRKALEYLNKDSNKKKIAIVKRILRSLFNTTQKRGSITINEG